MSDRPNSLPIMQLKQVSLASSLASDYILHDISFSVSKGDRLAILGSVGAGKTTLLRLLNRLTNHTTGNIYLENQDIANLPIKILRTSVVLVPQEPKLLAMTVSQALAYPLTLQNYPQTEIKQRLEYWRNTLHIPETWLEKNELQLSLGQRQLVAIARALVMQPKILLLDEPTSALDFGHAQHLLEVLINLSNTTILMVNHQLSLTEEFANRVIYLEDGSLLQDQQKNQINWTNLKDKLIFAETKANQEW